MRHQELDAIAQTRLRLVNQGYTPLPLQGKACYLSKWSSKDLDVTLDTLLKWQNQRSRDANTGLRCDRLLAVDVDVDRPDHARQVTEQVRLVLGDTPLVRVRENSGRCLLVYAAKDLPAVSMDTWYLDGARCGIELLKGNGAQFAAFGVHPSGASYTWPVASPENVPLADLPEVDADALKTLVERLALYFDVHGPQWGWTRGENRSFGGGYTKVYDLTFDMAFSVYAFGGDEETVWSVEDFLMNMPFDVTWRGSVDGIRSTTDGGTGQFKRQPDGNLAISDHARGVTHLVSPDVLDAWNAERARELATALQGLTSLHQVRQRVRRKARQQRSLEQVREAVYGDRPPGPRPDVWPPDSPLADVGAFEGEIVDVEEARREALEKALRQSKDDEDLQDELIYVAGDDLCYLTTPAATTDHFDATALRGLWGPTAYKEWLVMLPPERQAHFSWTRPDLPSRQVSVHGGFRYFNRHWMPTAETDRRVLFEAGVQDVAPSVGAFFRWCDRLIPDEESRELFYDICAHKLQDPMQRPLSVIMVAAKEGTGRDTLWNILRGVYGAQYTSTMPYRKITSRFNAKMEHASWVYVPELPKPTGTFSSQQKRREDVYETLKEYFSPGKASIEIEGKGVDAREVTVHFTGFIATNHASAVPVRADARRFLVVENGRLPTPEEIEEIQAWMRDSLNILALRVWLRERKVTRDVFAAPTVAAHRAAVEAAERAYDEVGVGSAAQIVRAFLRELKPGAFTVTQVHQWACATADVNDWPHDVLRDKSNLRYAAMADSVAYGPLLKWQGTPVRARLARNEELTNAQVRDLLDATQKAIEATISEIDAP